MVVEEQVEEVLSGRPTEEAPAFHRLSPSQFFSPSYFSFPVKFGKYAPIVRVPRPILPPGKKTLPVQLSPDFIQQLQSCKVCRPDPTITTGCDWFNDKLASNQVLIAEDLNQCPYFIIPLTEEELENKWKSAQHAARNMTSTVLPHFLDYLPPYGATKLKRLPWFVIAPNYKPYALWVDMKPALSIQDYLKLMAQPAGLLQASFIGTNTQLLQISTAPVYGSKNVNPVERFDSDPAEPISYSSCSLEMVESDTSTTAYVALETNQHDDLQNNKGGSNRLGPFAGNVTSETTWRNPTTSLFTPARPDTTPTDYGGDAASFQGFDPGLCWVDIPDFSLEPFPDDTPISRELMMDDLMWGQ